MMLRLANCPKIDLLQVFRATLFLTCVTAILHHMGYLDALDVVALRILPQNNFEKPAEERTAPYETLVLGITQDLFESEFGGHVPINRDRFADLISEVKKGYPHASVIAIDYDLSPAPLAAFPQNSTSTVNRIAQLEAEQQDRFDVFLQSTPIIDNSSGPKLVFITPLPFSGDAAMQKAKCEWIRKMMNVGIRFGDHSLLNHNFLAAVVKYTHDEIDSNTCGDHPKLQKRFAAAVNETFTSNSLHEGEDKKSAIENDYPPMLINFGQGQNAIYLCPLWSWSDLTKDCKDRLNKLRSLSENVKQIFIGAIYGEEDRFRTPIGDRYGVELHAFAAYTQRHPVNESPRFGFIVDILIGFSIGLVFDFLWGWVVLHEANRRWFLRFLCVSAVFIVLGTALYFALKVTPKMLQWGTWMNPVIIILGLLVHSYSGIIEELGHGAANNHGVHTSTMGRPSLFARLVGWPPPAALNQEPLFQFSKRVLFYWGIVSWGLYAAFFAH